MTDSKLTDHFYLSEVTKSSVASRLGIPNTLPNELSGAVYRTAIQMEKVRAVLGNVPVTIDSWYRSLPLNRALKSKDTSQHTKGEAVDFICPTFGTPLAIAKKLLANKDLIRYDQLILEHTWIHISWNSIPSSVQRGEVLSLLSTGGYAIGLTDSNGAVA